jgi:hypothetical protein
MISQKDDNRRGSICSIRGVNRLDLAAISRVYAGIVLPIALPDGKIPKIPQSLVGIDTEEVSRRDAEAQRMTENEIGTAVIEAAIAVHRELGPGLLETVYEVILSRELQDLGLQVKRDVPVAEDRFDKAHNVD